LERVDDSSRIELPEEARDPGQQCQRAVLRGRLFRVEAILRHRPLPQPIDEATLAQARMDFSKLSRETAQRSIRFWRWHNRIEK
jgi:hypothetical protein